MTPRALRALLVAVVAVMSATARGQGVPVSGVVTDSLTGRGLAGAVVQIVPDTANAVPRTAVADSTGHYRIEGVTRGRYLIGFFHPMLDSLTLEPILRQIDVAGNVPVPFDLALPSPARLRAVFCGPRTAANAGAAFVGVVRDARDAQPVAGAAVVAEWIDMVIGRGGVSQRPSRLATTSGANGWFALCGVPGPGLLSVHARRQGDTTDLIDVEMSAGGFARRDLYLGSAGSGGRLSGRVVTMNGGPIGAAMVSVPGSSRTRSNLDGEWTLKDLRPGTRMLEIRAIGYYPFRRAVDVVPDAPPLRVQMGTLESVLDTMRIKATGIRGPDEGGFDQRRRSSGFGRFITEEQIRRRNVSETSLLLRTVPGMYVTLQDIKIRGGFASGQEGSMGECTPAVFLDGMRMPTLSILTPDELDSWVKPENISAIEIYPDAPPPQFQASLGGCGSIVIWTKRKPYIRKPPAD